MALDEPPTTDKDPATGGTGERPAPIVQFGPLKRAAGLSFQALSLALAIWARRHLTSRALATLGLALQFAALHTLAAQSPATVDSVPTVDSDRLLHNLSVLSADSMEGRRAGSPGGERARRFLLREFARIGLQPAVRGFTSSFTVESRFMDRKPGDRPGCARPLSGRVPNANAVNCDPLARSRPLIFGTNLLGVVRGTLYPDRYIIVSAHYDHLGFNDGETYNGADDNASGSAAILAIAEWTVAHPPLNSTLFVWFDGEEEGLLGSTEFARKPPFPIERIAADVNVDMVSHSAPGELYAAGARLHPEMQPFVDSVRALGFVKLLQGHDSGTEQEDWTHRSDEGPLYDRGIPFIHFGNEEHADYHRPSDTFAHITPTFYYQSVRTIADFVRVLDRGLDPVAAARRRR